MFTIGSICLKNSGSWCSSEGGNIALIVIGVVLFLAFCLVCLDHFCNRAKSKKSLQSPLYRPEEGSYNSPLYVPSFAHDALQIQAKDVGDEDEEPQIDNS